MSRPKFRSSDALAAVAVAVVMLVPARSSAQACCAGGGAYQPARLKAYEDELVGIKAQAVGQLGSFDGNAHYLSAPAGTSEVDLEEDLFGTIRFLKKGQVALDVPFVGTSRAVPGLSEFGGGIGDLSLSARWDFLRAGESRVVPGIALLAGVTFPTGRPIESATTPLATGATGTGAWQGGLGLSVEQIFGFWIVDVTANLAQSLPRTVDGLTELLGWRLTGLFAVGYALPHGRALALALSYTGTPDAVLNGETVPGSGQRLLTSGLDLGWPLGPSWRLQGAVTYDLPVLGRNRVAGIGGTLTVIYAWF